MRQRSVCGFDEVNPEEKEVFERFLQKFAMYGFGERLYRLKYNPPLKSGDVIDHHIIGYLAPLDFKRIGWGGRYAAPGEQIIRFADYFKRETRDLSMLHYPVRVPSSAAFVRTSTLQFSQLARGQWFNIWSTIPLR